MAPLARQAARTVRLAAVLAFATLAGCATTHAGRTTVILMPDEDGHVGAVSVSSAAGARPLANAFAAVTVDTPTSPPSDPRALGEAAVRKDYADLLRAQPLKPRTFTLNFILDSTTLTDESKAMVPAVIQAARERRPTEISVFGHADASGSERHNVKLSAERARVVAALMRRMEPSLDEIDVEWFGDRVLLVPSETREPRNRRVEILIL
jgi:peptidoglycan-associated lipoprotein